MHNPDATNISAITTNTSAFAFDTQFSRQSDMPLKSQTTHSASYLSGISGEQRPTSLADSSSLLSIIFISIAFVLFNFKHCRRIFSTLTHELLNDRQRANAFDERTSNENRVLALLIFILCVFEGIILYFIPTSETSPSSIYNLPLLISLIGLSISYYIFQLTALVTIGYSFTDSASMAQWIKGFNGSQLITLLLLTIPALTMVFYPNIVEEMTIISLILYIFTRILFIFKGFRIFYHKFYSLIYFILYLCTLEIIPLVFLHSGVLYLKDILQ